MTCNSVQLEHELILLLPSAPRWPRSFPSGWCSASSADGQSRCIHFWAAGHVLSQPRHRAPVRDGLWLPGPGVQTIARPCSQPQDWDNSIWWLSQFCDPGTGSSAGALPGVREPCQQQLLHRPDCRRLLPCPLTQSCCRIRLGSVQLRPLPSSPVNAPLFRSLFSRNVSVQQRHRRQFPSAPISSICIVGSSPALPFRTSPWKAFPWPSSFLPRRHSCEAALPKPQPHPLAPWATGILLPPPVPSSGLLRPGDAAWHRPRSPKAHSDLRGTRFTLAGQERGLCIRRGLRLDRQAGEDGQGENRSDAGNLLRAPNRLVQSFTSAPRRIQVFVWAFSHFHHQSLFTQMWLFTSQALINCFPYLSFLQRVADGIISISRVANTQ